ncbi:MAG: hypothetical protein KGZ43_06705 [Sulfuritalea sp.]|nr:hypothetical protein [Sulfuritalea sp.]
MIVLLRIVAILAAVAIAASVVAYLFSGDRRYLGYAWRVAKLALILALILFALLALERLAVFV